MFIHQFSLSTMEKSTWESKLLSKVWLENKRSSLKMILSQRLGDPLPTISDSQMPPGCPTVQLNFDTNHCRLRPSLTDGPHLRHQWRVSGATSTSDQWAINLGVTKVLLISDNSPQ